jgi:ribonuclease J
MTLIQTQDACFLIDCGILFPYEDFFDIDYLITDLSFLDNYPVTDIIFTHGHEDHIGAVAHLLRKLPDLKVHATQFASSLIRNRLKEQNVYCKITTSKAGFDIKIGKTVITPIHVTHSIPETTALVISNKDNDFSALFMSDFKYDRSPEVERPFDIENMKRLMNQSKLKIAMLDSTNILYPSKTTSESELIEDIHKVVAEAKGRLFVTLFSSNIFRMDTFIKAARAAKRPFATLGRSVNSYMKIARECGLLQYKESELNEAEDIIDREDCLIFVSGCQGDYRSAMRRLAYGEHGVTTLKNGDTVIFSSKVIPGNEDKVFRIYNKITEAGAEIITARDRHIHASGHASQEDLKNLVSEIQPDIYIPIHGETFFLKRHQDFIEDNFKDIRVFKSNNFKEINIYPDGEVKTKQHDILPPVIIHGDHIEIERNKISERRKMGCNGAVFISCAKDKVNLTMQGIPEIGLTEQPHIIKLVKQRLNKTRKGETEDDIKVEVRRYLKSILGYKPQTFVHIH